MRSINCRFDVLQGSQCFTCTVGMKISKAQYYVEDTDAVVNVMQVCGGTLSSVYLCFALSNISLTSCWNRTSSQISNFPWPNCITHRTGSGARFPAEAGEGARIKT